jgi:hypothetical protein
MQYFYIEYQRVRRAIFIALILLALFFLATLILRLNVGSSGSWIQHMHYSSTARVTHTQLADGSVRSVVDDPADRTHAVIIKHPDGSVDADITEPRGSHEHNDNFNMGSLSSHTEVHGNTERTTAHWKPGSITYQLGSLFLLTIPMGLIVASLLAGALAKENDGHLELAWTKPVSREKYALETMLTDAAGIVFSQLLTIGIMLLATLMFFVPQFGWPSGTVIHILMAIAGPISWYALITAASASLKRGPGAVVGLGWVLAIVIPAVAAALQGLAQYNAAASWFYTIFHSLSYLDPIAYLTFNGKPTFLPAQSTALVLWALVIGYSALAVAQWRRVEA